MPWSAATAATAKCKRQFIGFARRRISTTVSPWTCSAIPKRRTELKLLKPSTTSERAKKVPLMMLKTLKKERLVYQLKVTLKGSKPPIWRRIQVTSDTSLAQLHQILQTVMGWTDTHLHQFVVAQKYYGTPDPEFDFEVEDESRIKLSQIAPDVKKKFMYEYDFGD